MPLAMQNQLSDSASPIPPFPIFVIDSQIQAEFLNLRFIKVGQHQLIQPSRYDAAS